MALFLKITSPKVWVRGDFSDDNDHDINMTIYKDNTFTTVQDLTSYTKITIKLIDPNHNSALVQTLSEGISVTSGGLLTWKPTLSNTIHATGLVQVRPVFEKTGEKVTGIGISGTDEIFVRNR
jgi:hypothetical protein